MVRPISIKTSAPPFLMHHQPEHVCLHYSTSTNTQPPETFPSQHSADIWTAPLCSVCYSCANWRWTPLSPPLLPVWQRLTRVPLFLEPCGRMQALTNRRHACLKWHETESVECVVKSCTCVCYLKPRRYDKQSMNLRKFAICSEADTFTAHLQQTKDVFKMSFKFKIMFQGHDSACGQGFRSTRWILSHQDWNQ